MALLPEPRLVSPWGSCYLTTLFDGSSMDWLIEQLLVLPPVLVLLSLGLILLSCGLGLPVPEDITLITAGYLAYRGVIDIHVAFAVCFLAVLGGDAVAFSLGRCYGSLLLKTRLSRWVLTPRRERRIRAYFRKYGDRVIFIGRFLPGLRFSIFFSAGMLRLRSAVFLTYNGLAALLSVPALVYSAWYFGDRIDQVLTWVRRSEHGVVFLVVVALAIVAFKTARAKREQPRSARRPHSRPPATVE